MYVGTYEGTYHPAPRSNPSFAKVLPNKILLPSQGQNYMCCGLFFCLLVVRVLSMQALAEKLYSTKKSVFLLSVILRTSPTAVLSS